MAKDDKQLRYKGYTSNIDWCADDQVFRGRIEDIGDMVTYESGGFLGAAQKFREAVDGYIKRREVEGCKPTIPSPA